MAKKMRNYVNPSSLGSYFGVGFNTPTEQLSIDMGITEAVFDDASKARMLLGTVLEDASLDYFEKFLDIEITNRNEDMLWFYEDKIKGIVDGMTVYRGVKTVVENKISNSKSSVFVDSLAYKIQVHCYMLATDTEQALLCGLYQGKPIYKLIKRDEELIEDIKRMTNFIYEYLLGFESIENYPNDLVAKYTGEEVNLTPIEGLTDRDIATIRRLSTLKERAKETKKEIDEIVGEINTNWDLGILDNEEFKLTVKEATRKGNFDKVAFGMAYPDIDLDKFNKPSTTSRTVLLKTK